MNESERLRITQEWAARLACAIYNGEGWDKQAVASFLHMGDSGLDYMFVGDPPETLNEDDFIDAMNRIFERAGL